MKFSILVYPTTICIIIIKNESMIVFYLRFINFNIIIFFFFFKEFQRMAPAHNDNSLLSDQVSINFWYRRGLNLKSLIQLSEILPVELTRTHK